MTRHTSHHSWVVYTVTILSTLRQFVIDHLNIFFVMVEINISHPPYAKEHAGMLACCFMCHLVGIGLYT